MTTVTDRQRDKHTKRYTDTHKQTDTQWNTRMMIGRGSNWLADHVPVTWPFFAPLSMKHTTILHNSIDGVPVCNKHGAAHSRYYPWNIAANFRAQGITGALFMGSEAADVRVCIPCFSVCYSFYWVLFVSHSVFRFLSFFFCLLIYLFTFFFVYVLLCFICFSVILFLFTFILSYLFIY